jgi:alpha-mannosidase
MVEICNKVQEVNITFIMSTPSRFTDALKKENIAWPVVEGDPFLPYIAEAGIWTCFFSSRPGFKKQIKDTSAFFNAEQNAYARWQIDQNTSIADINKMNKASFDLEDSLSVMQHHDAITGTSSQHVIMDYQWRLYQR